MKNYLVITLILFQFLNTFAQNNDSLENIKYETSIQFFQFIITNGVNKCAFDTIKPTDMKLVNEEKLGHYNPETDNHDLYTTKYTYQYIVEQTIVKLSIESENDNSPITEINCILKGNYNWFNKYKEIVDCDLKSEGSYPYGHGVREKLRNKSIVVILFENSDMNSLSITIFKNNK